jgi:hypothetical protein
MCVLPAVFVNGGMVVKQGAIAALQDAGCGNSGDENYNYDIFTKDQSPAILPRISFSYLYNNIFFTGML